MSISNQNQKVSRSGDGTSHQFSFDFRIAQAADLVVIVRNDTTGVAATKTLDTHFIIPTSSVNSASGGNILFKFNTGTSTDAHYATTDQRPQNGETIIIKRVVQLTQGVDLQAADSLPADTLEDAYDKLTFGLQQVQEQIGRALLRPASDSTTAALPDNVDLKGKVLQFNATSGAPEAVASLTDAATSSTPGLMSTADKSKLDGIEAGATGDQDAAEIRTLVESATDSNVFTDADHSKLDGIEAGADVTDATNVDAAGAVMNSDTTTASMQFVVDEDNMASNTATKVPTQQSVKAYVDSQVQTKDALSELSGDLDDITDGSNHVKMTNAERTKLTGIETNATADQTDAEIKTAYENNSDTNAFTDAEQTKLSGIETGATADQTDSEIRALVASATDSNVFTDADHTKLDGIETGATADQTASEILTAIKTVDGASSGLDADLLDGQEGSYYQAASTALTTSTTFGGDVSGTYNSIVIADDSHNHVINNVDGLQDALNAKAPLASPALTGTPTAPTASADTSTTQIATTAFVQQELTALVDSAPNTLNTLNEIAAAINDDPNFNTTVTTSLGNRLRVDTASQGLTSTQKSNARTNIGLTDAEIKTAYENNSDTNAFTDTLLSKLNGIESSATGDQTASEILTAIKTVDGTESGLDADLLDGLHSSSFLRANAQDDKTSGTLRFTDNVQAAFGSSYDMKLYHNGTDSYVTNDTGHLYIGANADGDVGGNLYLRAKVTEDDTSIVLQDDSTINFYMDGSLRMQMYGVVTYSYADIRLQGFAYDLVYDKGTYTTTLTSTNPTSQDQTITLPDATGTVLLTNGNGSSLTNLNASNISSGTISTDRLPSLTVAQLASDSVTTSSESFADNDTTLMTSAAINDRIESFGYSTTTGTVTSVGTTGTVNGITLTGTVTSSGNLTLGGTLGNITVSQLAGSALTTSAESFADNDTTLMTSAAINDRIESFGYTTNTGDITGVTAGTGLSGGGDSGSVTLNVSGLTVSELAANSLTTSSESFADNDTTLMTSAAINDRIESFGYITSADGGNAQTLDSLDSTQFLRSDAADTKTSGNLTFSDNIELGFGTGDDLRLRHDGTDSYISNKTGNLYIGANDPSDVGGNVYLRAKIGENDTSIVLNDDSNINFFSDGTERVSITPTNLISYVNIIIRSNQDIKFQPSALSGNSTTLDFATVSQAATITVPNTNGTLALNESGILNLTNSGSQSELRLYCESANAHYAALKAPAHSAFSGNVDITLPATAGTLALTSSNITGNAATATTATSATNSDTVDNKHISVVTSLPGSPDANTIYFVTG